MPRRSPARKRKRTETNRSLASGISELSDISTTTEEATDTDERKSRNDVFLGKVGQPSQCLDKNDNGQRRQLDNKTSHLSEETRSRRVSWNPKTESEETRLKEIIEYATTSPDNAAERVNQNRRNITALKTSAENLCMTHAQCAGPRCHRGEQIVHVARVPVGHCNVNRNHGDFGNHRHFIGMQRTIESQQRIIERLENDLRRRHTNMPSQRLSQSVTCIPDPRTPTARVFPLTGNAHGGSEARLRTNGVCMTNESEPDDDFIIYRRHNHGGNQRRSRSCDDILDEGEHERLLPRPLPSPDHTGVSSDYEDIIDLPNTPNSGCNASRINEMESGVVNRQHGALSGCNGNRRDEATIRNNIYRPDSGTLNRPNGALPDFDGHRADISASGNIYRLENDSLVDAESKITGGKWKHWRLNFRKLFYILVVLNTVVVVCGVSVLYVTMTNKERDICLACEALAHLDTAFFIKKDDKCCFDSMQHLVEVFANVTRRKSDPNYAASTGVIGNDPYREGSPMVQYGATKTEKVGNVTRIAWDIGGDEFPIHKGFERPGQNSTSIKIPLSGIYFVYCKIHYYKRKHGKTEQYLNLGHSFMLVRETQDITLESAEETYVPKDTAVRHTSRMNFIHNFTVNDEFYVSLNQPEYLDFKTSRLGLFLLPTMDDV